MRAQGSNIDLATTQSRMGKDTVACVGRRRSFDTIIGAYSLGDGHSITTDIDVAAKSWCASGGWGNIIPIAALECACSTGIAVVADTATIAPAATTEVIGSI